MHTRLAIFALVVACGLRAQPPAQPAFEEASVRPTDPATRILDFKVTPGRLVVVNQTMRLLVREAYGMPFYLIRQAPGWFDTDRFDITAVAPGDPSRAAMMLMLRSLLEERFQLVVRRETSEGQVYEIAVGKNGPKLAPAKPEERQMLYVGRMGARERAATGYRWFGDNVTMALLAERLGESLRAPVVDRTGIKDPFALEMDFAAEGAGADDMFPSLSSAMQEKLGLKFAPAKGPVESLLVVSAEKLKTQN